MGLTKNTAALHRWMVSGPEMARLIEEFDYSIQKRQDTEFHHHEQKKHVQTAFAQDAKSLKKVIEQMENPFSENSSCFGQQESCRFCTMRHIERLEFDQYVMKD